MARTVWDAALALNMLVGHDSRDQGSAQMQRQDYLEDLGRGIQGVRVGVPQEFIWEIMDLEVEQAFRTALTQIESLGASIQEVSAPDLGLINAAGSVVQTAEAATSPFIRAESFCSPPSTGADRSPSFRLIRQANLASPP